MISVDINTSTNIQHVYKGLSYSSAEASVVGKAGKLTSTEVTPEDSAAQRGYKTSLRSR